MELKAGSVTDADHMRGEKHPDQRYERQYTNYGPRLVTGWASCGERTKKNDGIGIHDRYTEDDRYRYQEKKGVEVCPTSQPPEKPDGSNVETHMIQKMLPSSHDAKGSSMVWLDHFPLLRSPVRVE